MYLHLNVNLLRSKYTHTHTQNTTVTLSVVCSHGRLLILQSEWNLIVILVVSHLHQSGSLAENADLKSLDVLHIILRAVEGS